MRKLNFIIAIICYLGFVNTIFAQSVSVSFTRGFFGRVGSNPQQADNIINLTTLQITKVSFVQSDSDVMADLPFKVMIYQELLFCIPVLGLRTP